MNKLKREKYLDEFWAGYIGFDETSEGEVFGRIIEIQNHFVLISWDGKESRLSLGEDFSLSSVGEMPNDISLSDILLSGDIIRISVEKKLVELLAPNRGAEKDFYFPIESEKNWFNYLNELRCYFVDKGFVEVMTPMLVKSPGVEEYLHPFKTEGDLYLPTSPEFHLKKSLVSGNTKIFELKPCFRNDEWGRHHRPEFLMLEWYRSFANLDAIVVDIKKLVSLLSQEEVVFRELSVADAFHEVLGFNLLPETRRDELFGWAQKLNLHVDAKDSWNDLFFRLMIEKVEPWLESLGAVILKDYPPSQSALARVGSDGWAKRLEFYWNGLEIANAFDELNDPAEQRKRFRETNKKRIELGFEEMPVDEEFLSALEYGMPPSAGIALGVERLFMAIHQIDDIGKVRKFTRPAGLY